MAYKKLDYTGLQTLISCIKTYIDNRTDSTAEERYRDTMREFFETNGSATATPAQLTALCDEWYALTRGEWDGYTRFFNPENRLHSSRSEGDRGGDNAGLSCTPSTNAEPGQDDFAGNPLFIPTDVNWEMGADGQPLITAIENINCLHTFERNNVEKYVGVMQQTGYHWWTELDDGVPLYYYEGYSSTFKASYAHIEPLPEAVLPRELDTTNTPAELLPGTRTLLETATYNNGVYISGNNVRQWVLHAKYMASLADDTETDCGSHIDTLNDAQTSYTCNVKGYMTCCSGTPTHTYCFSHNTSHTFADNNSTRHGLTKAYSGATITDNAFLILMARIKYASLTMDGIIQGCVNYSFQYPVEASKTTPVKYVLVKNSYANNILVGSTLLVGKYNNGIDRSAPSTSIISGRDGFVVTLVEPDIEEEGGTYCRVWFDTDTGFVSTAGGANVNDTTYISSFVWRTGSCDNIQGNDGSPTNCTNGKEPAKLQGIEYMMGAYEVFADVILKLYQDESGSEVYWYQPYIVRSVANQATSITNNYVASGLTIKQPAASSWQYIVYMGYKNGLYFATNTDGGSSTTYTRDVYSMVSNQIAERPIKSYGSCYTYTERGGINHMYLPNGMNFIHHTYATRLSCNGNRGEYSAS